MQEADRRNERDAQRAFVSQDVMANDIVGEGVEREKVMADGNCDDGSMQCDE